MGWLGGAVLAAAAFVAWLYLRGPWRLVDLNRQAPALAPIAEVPRAHWRAAFERHVYGPLPAPIAPVVAKREQIAAERCGGVRGVEQWRVELGAAGCFHLTIVRPPGEAPTPVILAFDFAGNRAAFPGWPSAIAGPASYVQWYCRAAWTGPISKAIFGRHINGPPFELIAARGYAVALLYAGDIVPDHPEHARAALARFAPRETGALMGWAWTASRALDALSRDPRFGPVALFGQSRQGKTALLAGAFDERFAAIIALQSGRGGDAPTRAFEGESVAGMLKAYPHWFSPHYDEAAPIEQHQLLALIAPRPVLLGHAARDAWADPVGARAVREAAAPAFATPPNHFFRAGGHGIARADWVETLRFLDTHLKPHDMDRGPPGPLRAQARF